MPFRNKPTPPFATSDQRQVVLVSEENGGRVGRYNQRVVRAKSSRLARSDAMLTDPHHLHSAIIDIAFGVGFGDVSHFNRTFRRRFGETPSAVRASAMWEK
jgi:AraC-like DNA-binding protein